MSDALKFVLELVNKASGPAKDAVKSLRGVEDALGSSKFAKGAAGIASGMGKIGASAGKAGAEFAKGFAPYALAAITAVEAAFVGLATKAATFGFEQLGASEDSHFALAAILGDAKKADDAFAQVKGLSNLLGSDPRAIEKQLVDLTRKGLDVATAFKVIQGQADLKAMGADAGALVEAFGKLDEKGKLTAESIGLIAHSGVDPKKLRAILGGAIGSTGNIGADIEAALKSGAIDAATVQAATLLAITETTGKKLGALAQDHNANTANGLLDQIKSIPARLLDGIDAKKILGPIEDAMSGVIDVISGPEGQAAMQALAEGFGEVAKFIKEAFTPDNIRLALTIITKIASAIWAINKAFGSGFMSGFKAIIKPLQDLIVLVEGNEAAFQTFMHGVRVLGQVVGFVVGAIVVGFVAIGFAIGWVVGFVVETAQKLATAATHAWEGITGGLSDAWTFIKDTWDSITAWFGGLPAKMTGFAEAMVSGFLLGFTDAADRIESTVKKTGDIATNAMKDTLKIHSPSKVFMEIGAYTAEGFNLGVEQGGQRTPSLLSQVVQPPSFATGSIGLGGGSSAPSFGDVNVYVEGRSMTGDARKDGETIGAAVRRELMRTIEQLTPEPA